MDPYKYITYCGLFCGLCSSQGRVPKLAKKLYEQMKVDGYTYWGADVYENFNEFWEFLERFTDPDNICPGCRDGGGPSFCGIRKCAMERDVKTCPLCDDFPCGKIEMLAEGYHMLIPDGKRMKEIGVEKWIEEQKERAKTGFVYSDVRCHPYSVPEE